MAPIPQQTGVFASSARNATKPLQLHIYKTLYFANSTTKTAKNPSVVRAEKMDSLVVSLSAKLDCLSVATCRLRITNWITVLMQQVPLNYIAIGLCGAHECNWNYWE